MTKTIQTVLLAIFAAGSAVGAPFNIADPAMPNFSDAQKETQRAKGRELLPFLSSSLAQGEKKIIVAPGEYRLVQKRGEKLLLFNDLTNVDIIGDGVTIYIERPSYENATSGLEFNRCSAVGARGFTIDFDPPLYIQGRVTAIDGKSVDLEVSPGFPVSDKTRPEKVLYFKPNGSLIPHRMEFLERTELLGGRNLRVHTKFGWINQDPYRQHGRLEIGDYVTVQGRIGGSLTSVECEKMRFEDLTFYGAPGFGIHEREGAGGNAYRRCRIIRAPGTCRLLAANADMFHSYDMGQGPLIEGCEFSWSSDDCVNIHGFFSTVYEQTAPDELLVLCVMKRNFTVGTDLVFYGFNSFSDAGRARILGVDEISDKTMIENAKKMSQEMHTRDYPGGQLFRVKLDHPVPAPKHTLVASPDACGKGFIVRGNYFHDSITRGVLINGSAEGIIEGNRIERTGMPGILLQSDRYWLEGPVPYGITIRSNTIVDALSMLTDFSVTAVTVGAVTAIIGTKSLSPVAPLRDLAITGNTIERPGFTGILVANATNVLIADNRVLSPIPQKPMILGGPVGQLFFGETPDCGIFTTASKNVVFRNNQVTDIGNFCAASEVRGKWMDGAMPIVKPPLKKELSNRMIRRDDGSFEPFDAATGAVLEYQGDVPLENGIHECYRAHPPFNGVKRGSVAWTENLEIGNSPQLTIQIGRGDMAGGDGVIIRVYLKEESQPDSGFVLAHEQAVTGKGWQQQVVPVARWMHKKATVRVEIYSGPTVVNDSCYITGLELGVPR